MYNPITFVKDIIDLLRNPPGEAIAAMEITSANKHHAVADLGPRAQKYAILGDFVLYFADYATVVPKKDFHKHYAFIGTPQPDVMHRVKTIKPL